MTDTVAGTPALMRAINDRAALAVLLERQPLSRNQLSELSDVSKPTASQIVRRLEGAGLIESVGHVAGTSGPATALYGVRARRVLGVAIDVQSDAVRSVPVDAVGGAYTVAETRRPSGGGARTAADEVRQAVELACATNGIEVGAVAAVVVGLQASVSPRTDELLLPYALPGWPTRGTRASLETLLPWSVELANDANLAAVAERVAGAGRSAQSFALLWLGIGLGFAVDVDGALLHGARGAAGEIGTLTVSTHSLLDGPSVARLDDLLDWSVLEDLATRHGITGFSIDDAARTLATHPSRDAFFADLAPRVALAVPPAIAILDPERVILGGPIGTAGGDRLASLVRDLLPGRATTTEIVGATVTAEPVLTGARHRLATTIRSRLLDEAFASAHR
jgi:predicted NBD/HSP70 family sugar kinase